jgi:hypothetical protein
LEVRDRFLGFIGVAQECVAGSKGCQCVADTPHLAATLLPTELRLRSACIEMTERDALLPQSHRGIERAQSHGVFDLLDPDVRLAGRRLSSLLRPRELQGWD